MAVDVKALLGKKIGPVPVWGIPVAIIAGLAISYYRNNNASAETVDGESDGDGTGNPALNPVFIATRPTVDAEAFGDALPGGNASSGNTPTQDTKEPPDVVELEDAWTKKAIAALASTGKYGTSAATGLVQKYMAGGTLSFQERSDIDAMLTKVGLPPRLPATGGTTSAPAAPATRQGALPLAHTVKSVNDNTLGELAVLYYGRSDGDAIRAIQAANTTSPSVRDNKAIPVGTKVNMPKLVTPKYYKATAAVNTVYQIAAKNSTSVAKVQALNPGMKFPVKAGTSVRVL